MASAKVVGLGRPERLAEGATSGPPKAASTARASGMGRRAHGDRVQAGAGQVADRGRVRGRRDQGQRARPEGLGQGQRAVVQRGDPRGRGAGRPRGRSAGLKRGRPLAS